MGRGGGVRRGEVGRRDTREKERRGRAQRRRGKARGRTLASRRRAAPAAAAAAAAALGEASAISVRSRAEMCACVTNARPGREYKAYECSESSCYSGVRMLSSAGRGAAVFCVQHLRACANCRSPCSRRSEPLRRRVRASKKAPNAVATSAAVFAKSSTRTGGLPGAARFARPRV